MKSKDRRSKTSWNDDTERPRGTEPPFETEKNDTILGTANASDSTNLRRDLPAAQKTEWERIRRKRDGYSYAWVHREILVW